ncbi:hypothetical protein SD074_15380 [Prolixibacter sp. SD074]|nr:hypothetical protein SD074_15380 [Prolixibacter sp. SD074]
MSFYREANVIILGITTNYEIVGQYAAIEKIIKAIQSFMDPLSKALFPFFGRKLNEPNESNSSYVKFGKIFTLILVIILSLLYLFGPKLLIWYLGKSFESAIVLFQIMIPVVLFGGLNYYFGIIGLINLGLNKYFTKAVFITGILSVTLCYLLSSSIGAAGAAITMSISELILLSLIFRKISPWIKKKTRIEV